MIDKCKCGAGKREEFILCYKCRKYEWDNRKDLCKCGELKGWRSRRCKKCQCSNPNGKLSKIRSLKINLNRKIYKPLEIY